MGPRYPSTLISPRIHGWRSQKNGCDPTESALVSTENVMPGKMYAAGLSANPELNSAPSPDVPSIPDVTVCGMLPSLVNTTGAPCFTSVTRENKPHAAPPAKNCRAVKCAESASVTVALEGPLAVTWTTPTIHGWNLQ